MNEPAHQREPLLPPTKLALWAHQQETVLRALHYNGYMAAVDMGGGKSAIAVAIREGLAAQKTLILCPKSVGQVWPAQFEMHSHTSCTVLDLTDDRPVAKRAKALVEAIAISKLTRRPLVVVLNYDSCWREPLGPKYDRKNRLIANGLLLDQDWDMVIADESHRLKTPSSRASKFAARLRGSAGFVLLLTGTPMPHSPLDIYAQFRAMDPTVFGRSYFAFRARYALMGGYEGKQVVGFRDLDDLQGRFYGRAYRVATRDVVDLPEEFHETRVCELSPEARRLYHTLKTEMVADIEAGEITAANALVRLLRLQQICSGHISTDERVSQWVDNGKASLLEDLLEDLPRDEPVVVFAVFRPDLDKIKEISERLGRTYAELSGRVHELIRWQGGGANVLGVQIQAGGLGVDLTRARYCVYYSTGFSLGNHLQSLARVMRPGQRRSVYYYYLQARGTVDQQVYRALRDKREVIESVLRDMVSR